MKRTSFLVCLFFSVAVGAQDVKFRPKFISFRNSRLSLGLGAEFSTGDLMAYTGRTSLTSVTYTNTLDTSMKGGMFNFGLDLDFFSPNSMLGLWSGVFYTKTDLYVSGQKSTFDQFSYSNLELPLYLKFRTGKRNGGGHAWIALGASYNIITNTQRKFNYPTSSFAYAQIEDDNPNQLKNYLSTGCLLGYEIVNFGSMKARHSKNFKENNVGKYRLLFYLRCNYLLQNAINLDYPSFQNGSKYSTLGDFTDFDLRYFVTSFGLKFFFKLPKKTPQSSADPMHSIENSNHVRMKNNLAGDDEDDTEKKTNNEAHLYRSAK